MSGTTAAPIRIAVLGCGTVGSAVVRRLQQHAPEFAARMGRPFELVGVAVRDLHAPREGVDRALLSTDAPALVRRADIVVELIGGIEPARTLLLQAMEHGASVVTANKQLLGQDGPRLYEAAAAAGVDFSYEASVAGAIPLLRPMHDSLAGDRVRRVLGIVNGTTNFILDAMDRSGAALPEVLAQAQELGYAEADPSADVDGHDAQAKAAILASLAFHTRVRTEEVRCEGIMGISAEDIRAARKMGCVLKLLAIAERVERPGQEDGVSVRVHPTIVPRSHPLASVREAYNAVFVEAELAGEVMFYGPGAGGDPTASAVLGDLVHTARNRVLGRHGPGESAYAQLVVVPFEQVLTRYAVRLRVRDAPGVLARVATAFGDHRISIESLLQGVRRGEDGTAPLTIATHGAPEGDLARTVVQLREHPDVVEISSVLRMEGF